MRAEDERGFLLDRLEVELAYCCADTKAYIGSVLPAIADLRWAVEQSDKVGYPKDHQGSIKGSLGNALLMRGEFRESLKWRRQGRFAIGRSYGVNSRAYAKQLFDLSSLLMLSALFRYDDLRPTDREFRPAQRLADQALKISSKANDAKRYVFAALLGVASCLVCMGKYPAAGAHIANASKVLQKIAEQESSDLARVRRPRLLRA